MMQAHELTRSSQFSFCQGSNICARNNSVGVSSVCTTFGSVDFSLRYTAGKISLLSNTHLHASCTCYMCTQYGASSGISSEWQQWRYDVSRSNLTSERCTAIMRHEDSASTSAQPTNMCITIGLKPNFETWRAIFKRFFCLKACRK